MLVADILILSPLPANRARLAEWLAPLGLGCDLVPDEAGLRQRLRRQRLDPPRLLLLDGHPAEACYPLVNRLLGDPVVGELPLLLLLDNLADEGRRFYGDLFHGLDCMAKPLDPGALRERVGALLALEAARRSLEAGLAGADWGRAWQEGLLAADAGGRIRFASRQAARWLRLSPLALCGLPLQSLLEAPVPAVDASWSAGPLAAALGGHRALELPRLKLWRGDGGCLDVQAALLRSLAPALPVVLAFRPLADAGAAAVATVARIDPVSGLPARQALEEALAGALAARRPLALLLFGIDHLRHLNDTLGHDLGDLLLRAVASRLRAARPGGLLAALGHGRFALLLDGLADHREAGRIGRRLQAQFQRPFLLQGHEVFGSVSLGIALAPAAGHDAPQLLQVADQALDRARATGRGGLQFAAALHNRFGLEAMEREAALVEALRARRLALAWRGWRDGGGRALAWQPRPRWPDGGDDAEAVAQEAGIGRALAGWCLREALRRCPPHGGGLLLAPDPDGLLDARAPERLLARLRRHGHDPARVLLRIPWREDEAAAWARQLPRLAAAGLGLALQPEAAVIDLARFAALPPMVLLLEGEVVPGWPAQRWPAVLAGVVDLCRALAWRVWWAPGASGPDASMLFSSGVEACGGDFECLRQSGEVVRIPI